MIRRAWFICIYFSRSIGVSVQYRNWRAMWAREATEIDEDQNVKQQLRGINRKTACETTKRASPSRQLPRPPFINGLSTLLPPFRKLIYISSQSSPEKAFLNISALVLPVFPECWQEIMMDSNAVGNLIDMMMMSSSNSSSSGCENDAAATAAAVVAGEKKRRFSETQVKSLEVMFEEQAKLEPRKKQQLAKELGLQPRQVAIWFQNKRARWKSKQLERAYAALSAEYDALRSSFNSLLHQKNVLSVQVQRLAEMLESNNQREKKDSGKEVNFTVTRSEADQTQILSLSSHTNKSNVERKVNHPSAGKDVEHQLHKTKEQAGGGRMFATVDSAGQKQLCIHGTGWPSDQLLSGGGCSQWWEFLSYE